LSDADGAVDWAHWGLRSDVPVSDSRNYNHKSGVTPALKLWTDLTRPDWQTNQPVYSRFASSPIKAAWSGGTPTASQTATPTAIVWHNSDEGFTLSTPSSSTSRTLTVYVLAQNTGTTFTVSLGSSSKQNRYPVSGTAMVAQKFAVNFRSPSAGRELIMSFGPSNIELGAVLTSGILGVQLK
jgi:hypothetical protein